MINLTIKTLDSMNRQFCVNDECTVRELKENIRDALGIDINEQRLIFCGKVLNDNLPLSQYGVNEKVIHLVKGAPPRLRDSQNPSPGSDSEPSSDGMRAFHRVVNPQLQQLRQHWIQLQPLLSSDAMPDTQFGMPPAVSLRTQLIQRYINDLRTSLGRIVTQMNGTERLRNEYTSNDSANQAGPSSRPDQSTRGRWRGPRDLADTLEILGRIYTDFAPFQQIYINMLRESPAELSAEECAARQQLMNNINDVLHTLAHAYHAVSDISVHMGGHYPRLTVYQSPPALPVPLQTHINFIADESSRMGLNPNMSPSEETNSAANPTTETTAQDSSDASQRPAAERPPHSATFFDGSSSSGTVGVNITPESVSYHVNIEARVPTVAFDNFAEENQSQTPEFSGDQSQGREALTRADQQRLLDIDNVLRGLTQNNGVEVVMNVQDNVTAGTPSGAPGNAAFADVLPFGVPEGGGSNAGYTERVRPVNLVRSAPVAPYAEYDPYLRCYSQHARRNLVARGTTPLRENVAPEPIPNFRPVENIFRHFSSHDMVTMLRFVDEAEGDEGGIHAFMYLVAGHMHSRPWTGLPAPFVNIRRQIREMFQRLANRVAGLGPDKLTYIINYIVNQFNEFVNNRIGLSKLDRRYDHLESLRALLQEHFRRIFFQTMCTCNTPTHAHNYYILCRCLYIDFCSLFHEICLSSVSGVSSLIENLMDYLTMGLNVIIRRWLNMFIRLIINHIGECIHVEGARRFLRSSQSTGSSSPMDISCEVIVDEEEFEVPLPCEPSRSTVMPPQQSQLPLLPPPAINYPQYHDYACCLHSSAPPPTVDEAQFGQNAAEQGRFRMPEEMLPSGPVEENYQSLSSPDDEEFEVPLPCEPSRSTVMPPQQSQLPLLPPPAIHYPHHNAVHCRLRSQRPPMDMYFDSEDSSLENGSVYNMIPDGRPLVGRSSSSSSSQSAGAAQAQPVNAAPRTAIVSLSDAYSAGNRTLARAGEAETARSAAGDVSTMSSMSSPPESIGPMSWCVEQFEEAWTPVLGGDRRGAAAVEPESDAYLACMPSRKRRSVTESRPPHALGEFINEAARSIPGPSCLVLSENRNVRASVVQTIRSLTMGRTNAAADRVPEALVNVEKWIEQNRQNEASKDQSSESDSDESRSTKRMRKNS